MKKTGIHKAKPVFPVFLFLLFAVFANAQQLPFKNPAIDSLENKINLYGIKNQSPILFVHFDKNIYSTSENVWFTGYLLNAPDHSLYKTLSVTLVNDNSRSIIQNDKFVMKGGLAFGNTAISDTLSPGNYTFIVFTNRLTNGKPDVVFTQPITIKTENVPVFVASLNPIDTAVTAVQKKVMLIVNFTNKKEIPASVPVSYYVGNILHPVLKGNVKTEAGQYIFNIPSKLLSAGNNTLHVQVNYKKKEENISIALPVPTQPAVVKFYPEGGSLVNNIQSTVGWEVKTAAGAPLKVSALLYRENNITDTIETNSYGMGKFKLTPTAGSNYYIKLYGVNKKDTLYKLPDAIGQGPAISLAQALVNDTLLVTLHDERPEKLYLVGHNYKQLFFIRPVIMTTTAKRLKILIPGIPKGLNQLTLTDSLGRPFAERVFFAHYDQKTSLNIAADRTEYATRQKVNVKVRLDGKADSGFVSVACVQDNRIEIKKTNDIESFVYLKRELGDIPVRETYLGNTDADKQYLENVLLIKGWRRYTWLDALKIIPADTLRKTEGLMFRGTVTAKGNPIRKSVQVTVMNHSLNTINTDNTGKLILTDDDMVVEPDKKVNLIVNGNHSGDYHVRIWEGPYPAVYNKLAKELEPQDYISSAQENSLYMQILDNEHVTNLKEVKINGNNDDSFYGTDGRAGHMVERYSIRTPIGKMGVPNRDNQLHPGDSVESPHWGKKEVIREMVYVRGSRGRLDPRGADFEFSGIYPAKEFYLPDYSSNLSAPEYFSTLYWKHLVKITPDKHAEFSFYTSDITGRFKIVVQGVTSNDVVYGEKIFNVVKPKL